ncbi:MAG TPA: hypothetical protein VGJ82_06695 [Thermoanaerobaculia bacterium]|jgi:hypothetical protein
MIAVGKYSEAESLLVPMVQKDPDDPELHFLLGKVYLYTDHPAAEAEHQFDLAAVNAKWKPKIARAYSDAFDVVLRGDDDTKAGEYMVQATRADESLKDDACRRLAPAVEQRHTDGKTYRNLLRAEGAIGGACAAVAVKQIRSLISGSDKILDIAMLTDV